MKNENPENLLPFLSEQRLERVNEITNENVKKEKICAYALLRYVLFMECGGITVPPIFTYGEKGKPYLENCPDIFFSLSHAGGYSACVVYDREIGVDLQDFRPMKDVISAKICTPMEIRDIYGDNGDGPSFSTCRLWCMKESLAKLTGKGFAEVFDSIETGALLERGVLKETDIKLDGKDFFLSVCGYEPIDEIVTELITEKDIRYILS